MRGHTAKILGTQHFWPVGGGYIRNVTVLYPGYSESWQYTVGAGVPGDYASHSRHSVLRWCEDLSKPAPQPQPEPRPSGSGGGGRADVGGGGISVPAGVPVVRMDDDLVRWGRVGQVQSIQ